MASTNQGTTGYVSITEKQVTNSALGSPDSSRGNYSASSVLPASSDEDRGNTGYVSIAQKQVSSATLIVPDSAWGNYSASSVQPLQPDRDRGGTVRCGVNTSELYATVPPTAITVYKMTGYYDAGSVSESWTSTGSPNMTPPSGHTLSHIFYIVVAGNSAN